MLSLWARNIHTKRYEFITNTSYENRFYDLDQLDKSLYYEALVVNEFNQCIMYVEFEKPKILRKAK